MAHSKLRQLPRISYFEPEDPSFDEYIYCSGCRDYVYDMCPQHGPLLILPDTKVPEKTNYPPYVPRAALTIPKAFLHIARSYIPGAGLGVFSSVTLPNGLRFGPYRGVVKKNPDSSYCWQIFDKNNKPSHVVDGGDGHRSNWMRFINCSRNWNEQNLIAFQYKRQIYYRTIKIIPRNTELLVYYGSEAAHGLGIDLRFYNCQPQITEPTFTASENVKDNNLDKDHKPKIGINDNLKAEITGMNTKTNIAFHQREKVKESSILSVDSKSKSAIEVNKNIKKSVSSTQSKFIRHQNEPTPSTIENVKHSSDLCKDTKLQDHKTKKPFEINNTPKTTKNFTCDQCGKFFSKKKLLKEHIIEENKIIHHIKNTNNQKISSVNDFFNCDICEFKTKEKRFIESHLKVHAAKRVYTCHVCGYKSICEIMLKRHLRTHTGEKPYSCHLCEYKCTVNGSLKIHMRTHTGEKPYSCHLCEYKCTQKGDLKLHLRTHTGEKPYSCHLCEYKCTVNGSLKIHMRTHTGEKPYSCHLCEYKCTQKGTIKLHLRTHTGEKPYSCHLCEYKCTVNGSLKIHMRTHTGEKPYSCHLCEYKCRDNSNLKTHMRTHTGEKPYSCHLCEYKCTQKGDLKLHLRTHTGEKPYSCHLCEYKCTVNGRLKIHMRTHTGEKPFH